MKMRKKRMMDESGISLVEVVASMAILSLLLTTFLMMFIQSAKIAKSSENIIDATYIAQTEMERLYGVSLNTKYAERETKIVELGYLKKEQQGNYLTFEKIDIETGALIKVEVKHHPPYPNMTNVIVEVYESINTPLRAQMENILVWGEG